MKFAVGVALVISTVLCSLLRFAHTPQAQALPSSVAVTWSATSVERATWSGLQADYQKLDADIAQIITRSDLREAVIRYVSLRSASINKTQEEFLAGARAGHCPAGTTLLYDGVSWTTTETR